MEHTETTNQMRKVFLPLVCAASLLTSISCSKKMEPAAATVDTNLNNENVVKSYAAVLAGSTGRVRVNVYKDGTQAVSFAFDKDQDGTDDIVFTNTGQLGLFSESGYADPETHVFIKIKSNPVSFDVRVPGHDEPITSSSIEAENPDMLEIVEGTATATRLNFDITADNMLGKVPFDLTENSKEFGPKITAVFNIIFNKQTNTFVARLRPYKYTENNTNAVISGIDAAVILAKYGLSPEIKGTYSSEGGVYTLALGPKSVGVSEVAAVLPLYLDFSSSNVFQSSNLALQSGKGAGYISFYKKVENDNYEKTLSKNGSTIDVFFLDGHLFVNGKLIVESDYSKYYVTEDNGRKLSTLYYAEAQKYGYKEAISFVLEKGQNGDYTIQDSKNGDLTDQEKADASAKGFEVLVYRDNFFYLNGGRVTGDTNIRILLGREPYLAVDNDGRANKVFLKNYRETKYPYNFSGIRVESKFTKKQ